MSTNKKEPISFSRLVAPLETFTLKERIKGEGTIEGLKIRFFTGQQKSLQVRPYLIRKGKKIEDLITFPDGTDQYLSGDNDYLEYSLVHPVENDDELRVWVRNIDAEDTYTLNLSVTIDYFGGTSRVV